MLNFFKGTIKYVISLLGCVAVFTSASFIGEKFFTDEKPAPEQERYDAMDSDEASRSPASVHQPRSGAKRGWRDIGATGDAGGSPVYDDSSSDYGSGGGGDNDYDSSGGSGSNPFSNAGGFAGIAFPVEADGEIESPVFMPTEEASESAEKSSSPSEETISGFTSLGQVKVPESSADDSGTTTTTDGELYWDTGTWDSNTWAD